MIDIASSDTPRWVQRFQNFDGALVLLREGVDLLERDDLPAIVGEGVIQRFEFTFELAWKTLKDYLIYRKVTIEKAGPADIIRTAAATGYLEDSETWMKALDARNEMSHVYARQAFDRVLIDLRTLFLPVIEDLHLMLMLEKAKLLDV